MVRQNGEPFWAEGDLRILRDSKGREIGTEGLYRDVTDRILLQGFLNAETERVLAGMMSLRAAEARRRVPA